MTRDVDEFRQESIKRLEKISAEPLREYMELFSAATGLSKTRALTNIFEFNSERKKTFRLLKKYISPALYGNAITLYNWDEGFLENRISSHDRYAYPATRNRTSS